MHNKDLANSNVMFFTNNKQLIEPLPIFPFSIEISQTNPMIEHKKRRNRDRQSEEEEDADDEEDDSEKNRHFV